MQLPNVKMKRMGWLLLTFIFSMHISISLSYAEDIDQIKQEIIQQSINGYSGSCPCPYNRTKAGHKCGKRSAYSRRGGYNPTCYASDVTQEMIDQYNN